MKRYEVLFIALALGGCAEGASEEPVGGETTGTGGETAQVEPPPACVDREAVEATVERIRALRLFEVGELVGSRPEETVHCYAHQISGAQSAALERFADAAEQAAAEPPAAGAVDAATVERNLETIRALQIVGVGALIEDTAADHGSCYAGPSPCQEAADRANSERAGRLANVAAAVTEQGE